MRLVRRKDAIVDLSKLSLGAKVILFPILAKIFGGFKAVVLLYGKSKGN